MANETEGRAEIPAPETTEVNLLISKVDVLDRLIALGQVAQDGDILQIEPPAEASVGLPKSVPVLYKHASGEIVGLEKHFEPYRTAPARRHGVAKVTTLQSFVDLANRHKDDHSVIFASTSWPSPSLTAVLDYHTKDGSARYRAHKVVYEFPLTEEFKAWIAQNGKPMGQGDFAGFIEDRIGDLAAPEPREEETYQTLFKTRVAPPNEMIELSRGLQIKVAATVKNVVSLRSGEGQVVFQEEHQNEKGEPVHLPGLFIVCVPAFLDGDPIRIAARLRYRLKDGKITWWYNLYKWDFELRCRVKGDLDFAAMETSLPAYEGAPEA